MSSFAVGFARVAIDNTAVRRPFAGASGRGRHRHSGPAHADAGADQVSGVETAGEGQSVLRVRVRAAPEDGKANAAVTALLAKWLDEPKTGAELVSGGKSRLKQVLIRGEAVMLMQKFAARIASLQARG